MATENSKITDTLSELLLFVNDRIEGYQRAAAESQDSQHKAWYQQLVRQSQQFSDELNIFLTNAGGQPETGTTLKGKFYRGFMNVTSKVTGHDEKAILATNIHGEEWAIKAYEEALADGTLPAAIRQAMERQYQTSKQTQARLQNMASMVA